MRARTSTGGSGRSGASSSTANFGENLTVSGVDVTGAVVGERWQVGSARSRGGAAAHPVLEARRAHGGRLVPRPLRGGGPAGRLPPHLEEGDIGAGDEIRVGGKPEHGLTVGDVARIYHQERGRASTLCSTRPSSAPTGMTGP